MAIKLGHDLIFIAPCPGSNYSLTHVDTKANPQNEPTDPIERILERNRLFEQNPGCFGDDAFLVFRLIREEMARRDLDLPILAPACLHGVWTDVDLMQTMLLEPAIAHRHFTLATDRTIKLIDQYQRHGVEQVSIGGDFAGNRLVISPEMYRTYILPEINHISDYLHRAGMIAINTSDGNLWEIADDFLISSQVDGYLEIDTKAGMDLGLLKHRYGDTITFYGNMDCGSILSFSTPDDIEALTRKCLSSGEGKGGHIFCASNAISESVPLVNYLSMNQAYRKYFGLPSLSIA
jgi:hypothetical protein